MNYIPTASDLLEMSLNNFADHAQELTGKWDRMSRDQKFEFIRIAQDIVLLRREEAA